VEGGFIVKDREERDFLAIKYPGFPWNGVGRIKTKTYKSENEAKKCFMGLGQPVVIPPMARRVNFSREWKTLWYLCW